MTWKAIGQLFSAAANAAVAHNLFLQATGQGPAAVVAAKLWLQCRAGWRPTAVIHCGADGAGDRLAWVEEAERERVAEEMLRRAGYVPEK